MRESVLRTGRRWASETVDKTTPTTTHYPIFQCYCYHLSVPPSPWQPMGLNLVRIDPQSARHYPYPRKSAPRRSRQMIGRDIHVVLSRIFSKMKDSSGVESWWLAAARPTFRRHAIVLPPTFGE